MSRKGDEQLRSLMAEHPDLPMMVNSPSLPSDYDTYYLDVCSARVDCILKPDDVEKRYGDYHGLNCEKYYNDEDDAVEDVSEWLFEIWFDKAWLYGMSFASTKANDDILTEFCGYEYDYGNDVSIATMADNVARAIVQDMPWQDYIVIECY